MKNLILLLPLVLLSSCGLSEPRAYVIQHNTYDSPLKPCAYEYKDLAGNLCVVEINDKIILPDVPNMDSAQSLVVFSKMGNARECERNEGKKIAEEIVDNQVFQICEYPQGLYKRIQCYKGTLSFLFENRIVCLSYLVPSVDNPSNEMIKSKLFAMKERLKSNYDYFMVNGGKMGIGKPGREFKDNEGNYCVIESMDEHFYRMPPTCTREEYVGYLLNILADIQCDKKPGSKKIHSEMTDDGYFMVLDLPKGINNSEDCTKGILSFYKGDEICHLCYLVPSSKKADVEMLKMKLSELKRSL